MSFEGKTAVITGGAGGMGLQTALDLLAAGARVMALDIKPAPEALTAAGGAYRQGDVSDEAFVKSAVNEAAEAAETGGRLDYLVNAAGVLWFDKDKSCVDMDMDVWDRVMAVNLKSFALTARCAVPHMKRAGGGAMVHISSMDALRGDSKPQDAYGAAKAAVIRLSKSLAMQFARDGVRSNTVLPGPVRSPMQARWDADPAARAAVADYVPLGRIGEVEDIAAAVLFLLSDKAAFITGAELIVDGGCTAKL
ncbi:MAG: SDR family NAD(P)-dependent oxidoreductase [Rhodospirillales bacterium]